MFSHLAQRHDRKHISKSLERQKRISDKAISFAHDRSLAFSIDGNPIGQDRSLVFSNLSEAEAFFSPLSAPSPIQLTRDRVTFSSDIQTLEPENGEFECLVADSGSRDHALVVFHHWYARNRYDKFAQFFAARGITVVQATLPYHFDRGSDDYSEEKFFNASLGRTVRSIRQAVLDGRKVVQWLSAEGYRKVSVAGMCLGGTVAGLVAAHEDKVGKAVLMVAPASPAELVWTGETIQTLRRRFEPTMSLDDLEREWGLINLDRHQWFLTRDDLDMLFVLGKHDTIARPENSNRVIQSLTKCGRPPKVVRLNCGHSSVGMFPFNIIAANKVLRFLKAS